MPPLGSALGHTTPSQDHGGLGAIGGGGLLQEPQNLSIKDLELMHHYSTLTCFTMTDQSASCSIWQTDIPKLALEHPFLMHGLLALAAMHIHQTTIPPNTGQAVYSEVASVHQDLALAAYRSQLQSITEDNCHALFAFSSVLGALSYAFLQVSPELDDKDFIQSVTDIFELLVGSKVVVIEAQQWLRQGPLANFLVQPPILDAASLSTVFDALDVSLNSLSQEVEQLDPRPMDYFGSYSVDTSPQFGLGQIYKSAILGVKKLIVGSGQHEGSISRVIGWPVVIDGQFIQRLRQGDIMALVILAHYGAIFCSIGHVWWARGLGSRIVQAVVGVIGDGYHSKYLRGPMAWI